MGAGGHSTQGGRASRATLGNPQLKRSIAHCVHREDEFHVAQCLSADVSSFGYTREQAVANLKEAVELYFEGETSPPFTAVSDVSIGLETVNPQ